MKQMPPWLVLSSSLSSVGLIVSSQIMRAIMPDWSPLWWSIFGVASGAAAAIAWYDKQATAETKETHTKEITDLQIQHQEQLDLQASVTRVALQDALDPLIESLGSVATAESQSDTRARANQVVLQGLHAVAFAVGSPGARVRANYFKVILPSPRHDAIRLVHVESIGRSGKPRNEFNMQDENDRDVFTMLLDDDTRFAPNIVADLPKGMDPKRKRDYVTFLSVPARVGENIQGIVTVDALRHGDLSQDDLPFVRAVATVIATAGCLAEAAEKNQKGFQAADGKYSAI